MFRRKATSAKWKPEKKVEVSRAGVRNNGALGAAVVGAGNLAKWHHLPNLKKMPNAALRAIHSSSGARGKSYALRFGAQYCSSD